MRELPAAPALVNWFATFAGPQHAYVGKLFSLCERVRFTARLERDPRAPFCPECTALVRRAVGLALDYIVDSEARAAWAHLDLQNRMTEPELVHAKGGLPDPE